MQRCDSFHSITPGVEVLRIPEPRIFVGNRESPKTLVLTKCTGSFELAPGRRHAYPLQHAPHFPRDNPLNGKLHQQGKVIGANIRSQAARPHGD